MKNAWQDAIAEDIATGRVFADPVDLVGYRRDASVVPGAMPELVIRPANVDELACALRTAAQRGVAVTVRGAGTMYAGGAAPARDGIVLDTGGLDAILDIDTQRGIVIVEPGVRFGRLLAELARRDLTIGIVPSTAPTATVGGAVSANALGAGSPKFQSMGDEVAGLEVALADGTLLRTGSAAARHAGFFQRYCIGPDLTGLFLGADATMGVITKIALWLHPLPPARETWCLGFPDAAAIAGFLIALQNRESLLDNIWYAAVYDRAAVTGRMARLAPEADPATLPPIALGLDMRGDPADISRDRDRILPLAAAHGGSRFDLFDERYFRTLCLDQNFWYAFAGYFTLSRCAILMSSLPVERLPALLDLVQAWRERFPQFVWGVGSILCRRGLHGGIVAFYDEARQWDDAQQVIRRCAAELSAIGCVPYKSAKLWAPQVESYTEYHAVLRAVKTALDPGGILGPGNLGLDGAAGKRS
jgi:FAD/FMN-containing dehydrogenase